MCMVAIGLEKLGADEFVRMGFFDGGQFDENIHKSWGELIGYSILL